MGQEYPAIQPPKMEPVHPGAIVKRALDHEQMSVQVAADSLGVSRQALYRVLNGQAAVSPDMAVRLGAFLGNGPGLWLRMQASYDLWHALRDTKTRNVVPIASARTGTRPTTGRAPAKRAPRRTAARARA